jgi:hypothetical protein
MYLYMVFPHYSHLRSSQLEFNAHNFKDVTLDDETVRKTKYRRS